MSKYQAATAKPSIKLSERAGGLSGVLGMGRYGKVQEGKDEAPVPGGG